MEMIRITNGVLQDFCDLLAKRLCALLVTYRQDCGYLY